MAHVPQRPHTSQLEKPQAGPAAFLCPQRSIPCRPGWVDGGEMAETLLDDAGRKIHLDRV